MSKRYPNNKVLIFADTHAPFVHKGALDFLADVAREEKPDRIILNGDLADSYWFSQWTKDVTSGGSLSQELKDLRKFVGQLHDIFPDLIITDSNHDTRLWRKAKIAGIPKEMLFPYKTMIGAKGYRGWKVVDDFTFTVDANREQVYVKHHVANNPVNSSKNMAMNVVQSHQHTKQSVQYWANTKRRFFGVSTGCLIDRTGYAFAYSKSHINRPLYGCIVIEEGVPRIVPMK